MKQIHAALTIIIFFCLFGLSHADNMYQWVDDEGVTHFSNTPTEFSGEGDVDVADEIETSYSPDDEIRAIDPKIRNNEEKLNPQFEKKKIATDLGQQVDDLNREHKQKILNLESDLYQKELELENAERGFQEVDYSKSNWKMIKSWNDDHKVEVNECKNEIRKVKAAISAEKSSYNNEKRRIESAIKEYR